MKIVEVEAFGVTVPIEATLRHSYGVHRAFSRTIVILKTDTGLEGLSETAASPEQVKSVGDLVKGLSPYDLGPIRSRIADRFYWDQYPLVAAAYEIACIDLQGKHSGQPAYAILGGKMRESLSLAAYLFFRHGDAEQPPVETPEQMLAHAEGLIERFGFESVKLKGGVFAPEHELRVLEALREGLPSHIKLRFDPNASWTPATAVSMLPRFEKLGLEYLEDPAWGIEGMATVRSRTSLQLATNMAVVDFPQLATARNREAVDIVLSDPWYWGGATRTKDLASACALLGMSMGMHSGIELGIGMAVMAHTAVTIPNLTLAGDAHYHHAVDDIVKGERLLPRFGAVAPPSGAGWGVELDENKVGQYRELYESGLYANVYVESNPDGHPDPLRPGWFPVMPAW